MCSGGGSSTIRKIGHLLQGKSEKDIKKEEAVSSAKAPEPELAAKADGSAQKAAAAEPTPQSPIVVAADRRRKKRMLRYGIRSTIRTSPMGVFKGGEVLGSSAGKTKLGA